jgi:hypothetical protein
MYSKKSARKIGSRYRANPLLSGSLYFRIGLSPSIKTSKSSNFSLSSYYKRSEGGYAYIYFKVIMASTKSLSSSYYKRIAFMRSVTFIGVLPIKSGRLKIASGIMASNPFLYLISILNLENSLNYLTTRLLGVFMVCKYFRLS